MTKPVRKIVKGALGRKTKAVKKPEQKKNKETGNTSTAAPADPIRQERGRVGKRIQAAPSIQKAYNNIQAELKWLRENNGAPESIAQRRQSLKDMEVTHLIKPKDMKDVVAKRPTEAKVSRATKDKQAEDAEIDAAADKIMNIIKPQNKARGGVVKKSRTGAHDFRMNKGGLLLSSVDNRKKR